ncbi:TonB-dependent receptor [Sphingobium sp. BS19]|nr:TonB-dependent receptor [Sphingobium sp. BS19]
MMPTSTYAQVGSAGELTKASPASQSSSQLGDIVVTARKQSERLQTSPVAITAVTAEAIARNQIASVSDLQKIAPSISMATGGSGGSGLVYVSIRGQVASEANSASDPAVATYVDGVYYARPTSGNLGFLDAAQIEVLRGPQGTLFGRNTTGGAVTIATTQPTGEFGGYILGEIGNFASRKIEGAVTVPLQGDQLAMRIAAHYGTHDGYFDNPVTGRAMQDLDGAWAARMTVKWAPDTIPLTLTISADTSGYDDHGQAVAVAGINTALQPLGPTGPTVSDIFLMNGFDPADYIYRKGVNFDQTYAMPGTGIAEIDVPRDRGRQSGVAATLDLDFGSWGVKSISAWRKNNAYNSFDFDGTPLRLLATANQFKQDQYSQELQISKSFDRLNLIGGLYYFEESGIDQSIFEVFGAVGNPPSRDNSAFKSISKGAFIQANYAFTDRLNATAGYRHTWDKRSLVRRNRTVLADPTSCTDTIPLTPDGCAQPLSENFSYPAWTISLDYRAAPNAFLYIKSSRASRAGGLNTRAAPFDRRSFQPEEVTDIEVGAKVDLFDRRLRANVAAFASKTKGAQRVIVAPINNNPSQYLQNAGNVNSKGVELELTAAPWEGMKLTGGGAYLDTSYEAGSFVENRGTGAAPLLVDRSGEPVPQAPKWALSLGATQDWQLDFGVASFHLDYSWTDKKVIFASTATPGSPPAVAADVATANRLATIDSYGLLNGRIALTLNNGLEAYLWARNLTDKEYFTYAFDVYNAIGITSENQGNPRTFGAGVRYSF